MIAAMMTTVLRYGNTVLMRAATGPTEMSLRRRRRPRNHARAQTAAMVPVMGSDNRLASSHSGCSGRRLCGSPSARARSVSVASTKNTAIGGTNTATMNTQCRMSAPSPPETNCTMAYSKM